MKPITAALAAAALSCLTFAQANAAGTETDSTSITLTRSGIPLTEKTEPKRDCPAPTTKAECEACKHKMIDAEAVRRTTGYVTYRCVDTSQTFVRFFKPPTCTTPKPAAEERPGQCPPGTAGAWTQSLDYVAAPYPDCWAPGEWLPATAPVDKCTVPNRAPTISGTPAATGVVGVPYSFTPAASDPDGDALTFAIDNRPPWATFNTATGKLSGTPTEPGTRSELRIRVTDGRGGEAVLAFPKLTILAAPGGSVTLSWPAPTTDCEGKPVTDLANYRIVYGTSPSTLDRMITIPASTTRYVVERLPPATWHFAVAALNSAGAQCGLSPIAVKTIP